MNKLLAVMLACALLPACRNGGHVHDDTGGHAHDASGGHGADPGHAGDHGHGHGGAGSRAVTSFTDRSELFVEFEPLVRFQGTSFGAHLTALDGFRPVERGTVTVVLSGGAGAEERFAVERPDVPGIFRPVAHPVIGGPRNLAFEWSADGVVDRHDLGTVTVYADAAEAAHAPPAEEAEPAGAISYLKEQQWKTEFGLAAAERRTLRASLPADGTIRARPDGEAWIVAPVTGRMVTAGEDFPRLGTPVRRGQTLAWLAPRLGGDADAASLDVAAVRAELALEAARRERERAESLFEKGVVPERRVLDARAAETNAEAEAKAARDRLTQHRGTGVSRGAKSRIALPSPIAGQVARVDVSAGAWVQEGAPLFQVVDLEKLRLEVRVPEADVGRVRKATGAWFELEGYEEPFRVQAGEDATVTLGGVVDPDSRTVPLVFAMDNPGGALRVGMFARVRVLTGETAEAVAIPVSAVVDEGGQDVAYVQLGGESFERRVLRLGIRDAGWVEVRSGVAAGERVVSRGAYQVRLAAAGSAVPAHGHAH